MDLIYTAVTTLVAGTISSYLTIKLTLKKDLVNTRRDRLEKFAFSLYAIDELLEDYRNKYLFGKDEILINELHLNQVEMLSKLYFRSIENELLAFENEIRRYKVLMFQSQLELIKIQRAGDVLIKPLPNQKMMDECTNLIALIDGKKNLLLKALLEKYPLLD